MTTANVPRPTAKVGQCVSDSLDTNSIRRGRIPPASMPKPNSLPICPSNIERATPFMKPTRMGLDRKSASAPSRRKLAPMHSRPVKNVSVSVSER